MEWKFNNTIAELFNQHARQHIPDYDRVLELSVDFCKQKLQHSDPILEIGCAIGETVNRLHSAGFANIHAVDNSQDMLAKCPPNYATYYCTSEFPDTAVKFSAVLCNWTLHFIQDKESYLTSVYNAMLPGAFLILSEKTENSGLALEQYHEYKFKHGVSRKEIKEKADSLVGVMFPESVDWYTKKFQSIGFSEVYIANANWCFTTFVIVK